MVCIKDPLELGKTASLLPRLLSSFTCWSNLKYLNITTLLMPKVNILRVKFFLSEKTQYTIYILVR